MSYNGSGTFNINSAGQPVVTGTVISSTAFNALTADLGTGLSTAITKDGQTVATARIPFAAGINSSLVTDATNTTTGSIITAGGVGVAKALFVGTTLNIAGTTTLAGVTATSITDSGLTSGRVTYAGTAGLLQDSANLLYSGTDLTVYGLTVGRGAGAVSTNTAVGASALAANVSAGAIVAVGTNAGFSATGGNNTFVGRSSGYSTTSGTDNTYLGFQAGANGSASTGSNNVAVGSSALVNNTTASSNTAVGYQAGYTNQTGASSTYLGYQAGLSNTASFNVYIGNAAGLFFTGTGNVVMGSGAGVGVSGSSTGTYNVLIGNNAGSGLTSGSNNTFIGTSGSSGAGQSVTTGSKNTIIGGFSGNQGGLDIRTASNYIVLSDGDGNPRGYFDNGGNFSVGTTTANSGVTILPSFSSANSSGVDIKHISTSTSGEYYVTFQYNGGVIGYIGQSGTTAVSYNTSSDYRLKNTIAPMAGALAKVALLKPCTYKWNVDGSDGQGFIAHELAEVCPHAVTGEKDAINKDGSIKSQGIDTSFLVATLTAAIQEQQAIITALTTRITALEAK